MRRTFVRRHAFTIELAVEAGRLFCLKGDMMIRTVATVAAMTLASVSFVGVAQAAGAAGNEVNDKGQFYATPVQAGTPTDLPGERLIPGASLAAQSIDTIVTPIVMPVSQIGTTVLTGTVHTVTASGQSAPVAAPEAPVKHHHHHHYVMRKHHMMKKTMTKQM